MATVEDGSASVLVTGWISPVENRDDLVLGDVVGGQVTTTLGCSDEAPALPSVGDEVFVIYRRGSADRYPDCAEYQNCTNRQCGAQPTAEGGDGSWDVCDGQCVTDTRAACSAHREQALLGGELVVLPRTEPLSLDGEQVHEGELSEFHIREVCESRFPPPPAGSCDDTVEMQSCTLARRAGTSSSSSMAWGLIVAAAGIALWSRSSRRGR